MIFYTKDCDLTLPKRFHKIPTKSKKNLCFSHYVRKNRNWVLYIVVEVYGLKRQSWGKDMNSFIEKYADSIICEPSGLTYNELRQSKIQRMVLVESE